MIHSSKIKARNPKKEAGCFDTNDAEKALLRNTRNEQKLARNSRLVLKVILNSRHDTHVLYPARVGVAIKDLELSLRKSFLKDKLTLSINARDLLDSRRFRTITSGDGFWQDSENWRGGRRVGFTLTYNFGNMNKKKDKSKSRNEEPDMYEMD